MVASWWCLQFELIVCSTQKRWEVLFQALNADSLIALKNRSHHPPRHGERWAMNFHVIRFDESSELIRFRSNVSHTVRLWVLGSYNFWISLLAALKVFALSDHTVWQRPPRLVMRLKARRNSSVVRLCVSSKWIIRNDAHVNRQTTPSVWLKLLLYREVLRNQFQHVRKLVNIYSLFRQWAHFPRARSNSLFLASYTSDNTFDFSSPLVPPKFLS